MEIQIVTPSENIVTDEADEVYAYGPKGEFGVLSGYAHYVTPLSIGRLYYTQGDQRKTYVVEGGYMEVYREKIYVAADRVEEASTLDRAASEVRLAELEKQLGTETIEPQEFQSLIKERDREAARIQALA